MDKIYQTGSVLRTGKYDYQIRKIGTEIQEQALVPKATFTPFKKHVYDEEFMYTSRATY